MNGPNKLLRALSRTLCAIVALGAVAARAAAIEEPLDDPTFGSLTIYRATGKPRGVLFFASGTGGWNAELTAAARDAAKLDRVARRILHRLPPPPAAAARSPTRN